MVSTMRLMSQDAFDEPTARILRGWLRTGSCSHQAAAARPEHQRRGAPEILTERLSAQLHASLLLSEDEFEEPTAQIIFYRKVKSVAD